MDVLAVEFMTIGPDEVKLIAFPAVTDTLLLVSVITMSPAPVDELFKIVWFPPKFVCVIFVPEVNDMSLAVEAKNEVFVGTAMPAESLVKPVLVEMEGPMTS
jgi:hypothetical protein